MTPEDVVELLSERGPLSSHEIIRTLVRRFRAKRPAVRQCLTRSVRNSLVIRFIALDRRQYLYCLEHQRADAQKTAISILGRTRPRLFRLYVALEKASLLTIWEAARLVALDYRSSEFRKLLDDMDLLDVARESKLQFNGKAYDFILYNPVFASQTDTGALLENYCKRLTAERYFVDLARSWLKQKRLAKSFRCEDPMRRGSFDLVGVGVSQRFSNVVVEVNLRRTIDGNEMKGFINRVYKFRSIEKRKMPPHIQKRYAIHSFFFANAFDTDARRRAEQKRVKIILSKNIPFCNLERGPKGMLLFHPEISEDDRKYYVKCIASLEGLKHFQDMKGRFFEFVVYLAFREIGYRPQLRKPYYVQDGRISESGSGDIFGDIDVEAVKENSAIEIIMCECRNWSLDVPEGMLMDAVEKYNEISDYLKKEKYVRSTRPLIVKGIFIGPFPSKHIEEAKKEATFEIEILTKTEFRDKYCHDLRAIKGAGWIFE